MPVLNDAHGPTSWASTYATRRDALLGRIVTVLGADSSFLAAWLFGSFGRGEEDDCSDLDLYVVVTAAEAETLCTRPWRAAARTTPQRLALLRRVGEPVLVHEVHANAPEGGTHTNVLFADGTRLDLNLVPLGVAVREADTRLLFEKMAIPVAPVARPESLEARREIAAQRMALFWIMALGTAQNRVRGQDTTVHEMLMALRGQVETVRRVVAGEPPRFRRYARLVPLASTPEAQAQAVRDLCDEMAALIPGVKELGGEPPEPPRELVERWLDEPRTTRTDRSG
jgi:hypothetical protein